MRLLLICALALGGCGVVERTIDKFRYDRTGDDVAPPPPPPLQLAAPNFAVLDPEAVVVEMSDGTQCRGNSGAGLKAAGWSGTLTECPYPYAYSVELAAGYVSQRAWLDPVSAEPKVLEEGEVPFRPIATLVVTASDGSMFRFESREGF
jgi:hypothetical protein